MKTTNKIIIAGGVISLGLIGILIWLSQKTSASTCTKPVIPSNAFKLYSIRASVGNVQSQYMGIANTENGEVPVDVTKVQVLYCPNNCQIFSTIGGGDYIIYAYDLKKKDGTTSPMIAVFGTNDWDRQSLYILDVLPSQEIPEAEKCLKPAIPSNALKAYQMQAVVNSPQNNYMGTVYTKNGVGVADTETPCDLVEIRILYCPNNFNIFSEIRDGFYTIKAWNLKTDQQASMIVRFGTDWWDSKMLYILDVVAGV